MHILVVLGLPVVEAAGNEVVLLELLELGFGDRAYRLIMTISNTHLHFGILFLPIINKIRLTLRVILPKEHTLRVTVLMVQTPLLLGRDVLLHLSLLQRLLIRVEVVHGSVRLPNGTLQLLAALTQVLLLQYGILDTLPLILCTSLHTLLLQSVQVLGPRVLGTTDSAVVVETLTLLFVVPLVLLVDEVAATLNVLLLLFAQAFIRNRMNWLLGTELAH